MLLLLLWEEAEVAAGPLAAGQDGVGDVPLDPLQLRGRLQVLGEGGEALAAAQQSGRVLDRRQLREGRGEAGGGRQAEGVRLRRHGHGVVRGHSEVDPAGQGVLGFVLEVRVWTLGRDTGSGQRR